MPSRRATMSELTTTIAAVSTPPGKGGVAVIRLSGAEAFDIASRVFRPRGKTAPQDAPRRAIYGDFLCDGVAVDDGLATAFPAPASYTGEDTVELSCHGGMLITKTILGALFAAGASPAAAGEFTRRAYLSGRLGLSEAEAIATLLEAKSEAQIRLSANRGLFAERVMALYGEALSLVSAAEAVIDFPEEDLSEIGEDEFLARLSSLTDSVAKLCATWRTGQAVSEGIRTVIVGRPNVGKSSLYNLLLCEDAAIVSDKAGTTRDILERTVPLGRVLLRLYDTAGLRSATDEIEQIGVDRARRAMQEADLILAVFDTSAPLTEEDHALLRELATLGATKIAILNKSDLTAVSTVPAEGFAATVTLSAKHGTTEVLSAEIDRLFTDGDIVIGEAAIVSSARQYAALTRAHECLMQAKNALTMGHPADMYLFDLCEALSALGEVDGRTVGEEIVSEIFSHFCVGK